MASSLAERDSNVPPAVLRDWVQIPGEVQHLLVSWAVGATVFPAMLAAFQARELLPRRICAHQRVVAGSLGLLAVSTAGLVSAVVFNGTYYTLRDGGMPATDHWLRASALHVLSGVFAFRMLGGRFSSLAPSDVAHKGAFALQRACLAARDARYATDRQRALITQFGRKFGCHSCGRRFFTEFISDHQPPNKVAAGRVSQKYFPQCRACSQIQAGSLSAGRQAIVPHYRTLRLYHLWVPLGPLVAMTFFREAEPLEVPLAQTTDDPLTVLQAETTSAELEAAIAVVTERCRAARANRNWLAAELYEQDLCVLQLVRDLHRSA